MSNLLQILLRKEEYKGQSLQEIHDELINYTLFEFFPGTFDYFSEWHPNNKSYYGADDKDSIRAFVHNWRRKVIEKENKAELAVRQEMNLFGCDYITDLPDINNVLIWDLYQALGALTNHFSYSDSKLYYGEDYGWCTFLPEAIKNDAEKHPEKFVLIECFYH